MHHWTSTWPENAPTNTLLKFAATILLIGLIIFKLRPRPRHTFATFPGWAALETALINVVISRGGVGQWLLYAFLSLIS